MARARTYAQQRHYEEVARRKLEHEKNRDPELEQCVIEYVNWRVRGAQGDFEAFRRQWYIQRGSAANEQKSARDVHASPPAANLPRSGPTGEPAAADRDGASGAF